jgi:leader peptidase (prepilin peptidase)/N-methyltransferase
VSPAQHLAGGLVGVLFLGISKLSKEAIGYGDSWLIGILGILMGAREMLAVLFIASLLAAAGSLIILWKKRWNKKAAIPFVPFVAVVYLGAILL